MSDNEDLLVDIGDQSLADYNLGNDEEDQLLADDLEHNSHNVPSNARDYHTEYSNQQSYAEESVVPNVEHKNKYVYIAPHIDQASVVPPPIMANSVESLQIVPTDSSEKRTPQIRDIPDSLDKVKVPRASFPRPVYTPRSYNYHRTTWRNPNYSPYRLVNPKAATSLQQPKFPSPQVRPEVPTKPIVKPVVQTRPNIPPQPELQVQPEVQVLQIRPEIPQIAPEIPQIPYGVVSPERVVSLQKPVFEPQIPGFVPRFGPFPQPYIPEIPLVPQVTIRQPIFGQPLGVNPEVRMLPLGIPGKKVLINPHFKGPFRMPFIAPSVGEGATYVPTRIRRSPPLLSKETIEKKFGTDLDDAAEKFIQEQRSALASRANKMYKRDPQRYIENTTIEIENELVRDRDRSSRREDDLSRRQEAFIHANRAGLRRRMRSPSPPRRVRTPPPRTNDEDSEYRRKLREQELMRERLNRAKDIRRRKNATVIQEREKEKQSEKEKEKERNKEKQRTPPLENRNDAKMSLTPPHEHIEKQVQKSPERGQTPPLPPPVRVDDKKVDDKKVDYDFDDLELILNDFEGILSDDEDSGRFKESSKKTEEKKSTAQTKSQVDLRAKLCAKNNSKPRQKIVFNELKENKEKDKAEVKPTKREIQSNKDDLEKISNDKREENEASVKRQRITFDKSEKKQEEKPKTQIVRRVVIQRRDSKTDISKVAPGLFSRAIRNIPKVAKGDKTAAKDDTQVLYDDSGEEDPPKEATKESSMKIAIVSNLPHGMTDTRLKTLAGDELQSLVLDKEDRSAKITFKNPAAAETFRKKFNSKMVAASRLTVILR